jgi:hypothetical protein
MRFIERLRELGGTRQIPQRRLAAVLEFDTASYWKIGCNARHANRKLIPLVAEISQVELKKMLAGRQGAEYCSRKSCNKHSLWFL